MTELLSDSRVVAAILTALAALIVAAISGAWAVRVRVQENERATWRRVEELMQVVHNGSTTGLWAQKLAVSEMVSLLPQKPELGPILREASTYFRSIGSADLASHIDAKVGR